MLKNKNFSKEYRPQQYRNFLRDLSAFSESTTWRNIFAKPPYEKWESEEGLYLKLHGSVDWVYCPNEYCRGFGKVFPVLEPTKKYYCSNCHEEMVTLLIPPVLNKQYRKYPLIRRLWNTAAQEMHSVAELIIWGYSLPATDFYNEWLLREARKSKNIKKLILINPNNIRKGKQGNYISRTFVIRFYNLFRDIIPKELIELYEYFELLNYESTRDIADSLFTYIDRCFNYEREQMFKVLSDLQSFKWVDTYIAPLNVSIPAIFPRYEVLIQYRGINLWESKYDSDYNKFKQRLLGFFGKREYLDTYASREKRGNII